MPIFAFSYATAGWLSHCLLSRKNPTLFPRRLLAAIQAGSRKKLPRIKNRGSFGAIRQFVVLTVCRIIPSEKRDAILNSIYICLTPPEADAKKIYPKYIPATNNSFLPVNKFIILRRRRKTKAARPCCLFYLFLNKYKKQNRACVWPFLALF